jgi:HD-GYP domain-containing protein (c-di-GMP phosphodiesterase class II)
MVSAFAYHLAEKANVRTGADACIVEAFARLVDGTPFLRGILERMEEHLGEHYDHSLRVGMMYAGVCQRDAYLDTTNPDTQLLIGHFHDKGKLTVPSELLFKEGPLTLEERAIMELHVEGLENDRELQDIENLGYAGFFATVPRHHPYHDWEGCYPKIFPAAPPTIVRSGRNLAIVDAYDALASARSYKTPFSPEEIVTGLKTLSKGYEHVVTHLLATHPPLQSYKLAA